MRRLWPTECLDRAVCYELIRRGRATEDSNEIGMVANNLRRFFGLPDADAVLYLIGQRDHYPNTPPLFVDGLIPFTDRTDLLPFRSSMIDFRSPWTTWCQVVTQNTLEITDQGQSAGRQEAATA
jgi:hypothetical protein